MYMEKIRKYPDKTQKLIILSVSVFFFLLAILVISGTCKNRHLRNAEILVSDKEKAADSLEVKNNTYTDLSIPTQITKVDDVYFIVDCYHNQIIYNDNLTDPLNEWKVMTDEMIMGHTLAGDGQVYLVDDTENERILVFEKAGKSEPKFVLTKQFTGITGRPHFVEYHEETKTFYVWCSISGQMYLIKNDGENVYISDIKEIPELDGIYVRSFTIIGNDIYFVSGNGSILRADLDSFRITDRYPVPPEIAGMVQLTKIDDMYYITVSTDASWDQDYATIIRCDSLEKLSDHEYEDIYDNFIGGGTPYYITYFDNAYYMAEHRIPGHSIWRFTVTDGKISPETVY
ncbi:MAG: hypothetical protein K5886_09185 [Lachnospiraceae bacterium]|nr:hypothetical protein [Lachnospiraceae bacterium]